jgi:hypothetical protein
MEVVDLDMYYALDPVSESLFWNTKSCWRSLYASVTLYASVRAACE